MDGFTGYKTAIAEQLPAARAVMDPFHVVKLAGHALDETRRRVQQAATGRRGRADDPLCTARRALLTKDSLLTERQAGLLKVLLADQRHTAVEVTWAVHQKMIEAYRNPDPAAGRPVMSALIDSIATGVPAGIQEVSRLGRTLNRRREDILAYFDHPGASNGPTETINDRLEHLRGIAQGLRNLTHHITRSLIHTAGPRHRLST